MRIRSIEYDFDSETIIVGFEDGSVQRESLALSSEQRPTSIRHYRLEFATGRLELRLPNGSTATAELAIPGASDRLMLAGRLIVYLDQNLWSRLSAARYGQRVIPPQEHAAGMTLTQLVADRRIILPVSAGTSWRRAGTVRRTGCRSPAPCSNCAAAGRCAIPASSVRAN